MMFLTTSLLLCMIGVISGINQKLIDLTYTFNNNTVHWPFLRSFEMRITEKGTRRGFWLQLEEYSSSTHVGTHMDAPCKFAEGHWCMEEMPLDLCYSPVAVVDVTSQAEANRDYGVTIQDLQNWEKEYNQSLDGMVVLMRTGWGKRSGDIESYIGTRGNDSSQYHFPGMSPDAAQWIVDNRRVLGVGTDTISLDIGQDTQYTSHRILYSADIYGLVCVANLDKVPASGAFLYVFPMKIGESSGAPVRLLAGLPTKG